jgi:hypothetical protein
MKRTLCLILTIIGLFTSARAQTTNGPLDQYILTNILRFRTNLDLMIIQVTNTAIGHSYWEEILLPGSLNADPRTNWIPYKLVADPATNDNFLVTNANFTNRVERYFHIVDYAPGFAPPTVPEELQAELELEAELFAALEDPDSPESLLLAERMTGDTEEHGMSRNMASQVFNLIDRTELQAPLPVATLTNLLPQALWPTNHP